MNREVSIVIPTFNRAKFLIDCIDSCINQTIHCEIIVCDHGSTDNTPEVVKKYGNRITYVRREKDSGVHFCWMDGILHASHDLVHLNFDDDWIEPTFMEKCLALFSDDVGCVISNAKIFYDDKNEYSQSIFNFYKTTGIYSVYKLKKYNLKKLTSPCAGIYRKQILLDNLFIGNVPFSKNSYHGVGPDVLFSLMSTIDYPKFGYVSDALAIFRSHEKSITIDASTDIKKQTEIQNAYEDARSYYRTHKFLRLNPLKLLLRLYNSKMK